MRVAVIGQGSAGRRYAQFVLNDGHGVASYDPRAVDIGARCDSIAKALDGADAAIVASPSSMHMEHAKQAIEAGCPVLVEKPLATTTGDAASLAKLAAKHDVLLAVAMNMRHHSGLRLDLSTLGKVLRASAWCGSYLPTWHPGEDYRAGYSAQKALGGGVLLDVAVHEIDYLIWLLGRVKAVTAIVRRVSDLEIDVEDIGLLLLEFESGVIADLVVDYLDHNPTRGCRIIGDAGSLTQLLPPSLETYRSQLEQFLAAVRGEESQVATADEAVHVLEVIDAARRSSAEHKRIDLSQLAETPPRATARAK